MVADNGPVTHAQLGMRSRGPCEQIYRLRFDQEIAALKSGETPDSHVAPRDIDPLRRRYLHDSLRAISAIQTAVGRTWASGRKGRLDMADLSGPVSGHE
jgi:signal-transduction protein with cAMP-binding, CBS, and nucleotidyltransferase domain